MALMMNRREVVTMAAAVAGPIDSENFQRVWNDARASETDQKVFVVLREWMNAGAQSVLLPETFAAALMATSVAGAFEHDDVSLPWPCFEIQVPLGLLWSSHGEVFTVLVCLIPEYITLNPSKPSHVEHKIIVCYADTRSFSAATFSSLQELADSDSAHAILENAYVGAGLVDDYDEDQEKRLWKVLGRLIGGVVLTMRQTKQTSPNAYPRRPAKMKRDVVKPHTYVIGKPLTLDFRMPICAYVMGTDRALGRNAPSVTTLVRGHWKHVVHGEKRSKRKLQWIQPFYRGEGPLVVRPVKLDPSKMPGAS